MAKRESAPKAPAPPALPPANDGFPPELADMKNETPVRLPETDAEGNPPTGAAQDQKAAAGVAAGLYVPGREPERKPKDRIFEAPDGVLFSGPETDDIFIDPRNGRPIRPRRGTMADVGRGVDAAGRPLEPFVQPTGELVGETKK